jgi:hypothetical protein
MFDGSYGSSGKVNAPLTRRTSPIAPPSSASRSRAVRGWCGHMNPSIRQTPWPRQNSTTSCASGAVGASGFSHKTCLPRAAAARVHSACIVLGSGMYTASTSGSSSSDS